MEALRSPGGAPSALALAHQGEAENVSHQVTAGALLECTASFSRTPTPLAVLPLRRVLVESRPAATIADHLPMVNILPFGFCGSLMNPAVSAATAAASGVLTPQPCVPVIPAPWTPGAGRTTIAGQVALDAMASCACLWGGVVCVMQPGALRTDVA